MPCYEYAMLFLMIKGSQKSKFTLLLSNAWMSKIQLVDCIWPEDPNHLALSAAHGFQSDSQMAWGTYHVSCTLPTAPTPAQGPGWWSRCYMQHSPGSAACYLGAMLHAVMAQGCAAQSFSSCILEWGASLWTRPMSLIWPMRSWVWHPWAV